MSEVKHADPSALGLFGLAIVTLVASSQKLGLTSGTAYVIPWAIFLGGLIQIVAGILDYKKCNVFGGTAFCAYGFFWLGVAMSWLVTQGVFGAAMAENADKHQLGVAFVGYGIFTAYMTVGAAKTNKVLFAIFFLIVLLFIGLGCSTLGVAEHGAHMLAAYSELAISLLSFYGSAANILAIQYGRPVLPIGKALL